MSTGAGTAPSGRSTPASSSGRPVNRVYTVEPTESKLMLRSASANSVSRSGTQSRASESLVTDYLDGSRPSTSSSFLFLRIWERHRWFGTFKDPMTEEEFQLYFYKRFHKTLRRVYFYATVLILALATPSAAIKWPDFAAEFTYLTLATVVFPGLLATAFTYSPRFERHASACSAAFCVLLTVAPMYAAGRLEEAQDMHIISSIILIFGGINVLARLAFVWSLSAMTLVIVVYTIEMAVLGVPETVFQASGFLSPLCGALLLFSYVAWNNDRYMRENFIREKKAERDYSRLKDRINKIKNKHKNTSIDLDSGMEKVLSSLVELRNSDSIGETEGELLDNVIQILQSGNLLAPNIANQVKQGQAIIDEETQNWLLSELASKEKEKGRVRFADTPKLESWSDKDVRPPGIVLPGETEKMQELLSTPDTWNLDVFQLSVVTQNEPLRAVGHYLFKKFKLLQKFNISHATLDNFLRTIEAGYQSNLFHNRIHAADVTMNAGYLVSTGPLAHILTDIERLAVVVAAIIHDFRHPGQNNNFQVNTGNDIALTYNDRSVLENYHVSQAFRVARDANCNIFAGMDEAERKDVRDLVIETVLATDMASHFEILSTFKTKLASELEMERRQDRVLLLKMAIKCADIAHTTKRPSLHHEWTDRVQEEFFSQGDSEKAQGLPPSPFMDRTKSNVPKSQVGFLDFVVKPLFEAWTQYAPDHSPLIDQLEANHAEWKRRSTTS